MRILVIEDDDYTASYLVRALNESGHVGDRAEDGRTGLVMAQEGIYDALIVDRRLPGLDGIALVEAFRRGDRTTPILMLSAQASTVQRVEGLQAGADDYLAKPFATVEVLARLDGLLRTAHRQSRQSGVSTGAVANTAASTAPRRPNALATSSSALQVGPLSLDTAARCVTREGKTIALQHRECLILEKLMRHHGQVVTRSMLLESAWDYAFDPLDNVIDKHIHRLRRKLNEGFALPLIRTVTGAGYVLDIQGG